MTRRNIHRWISPRWFYTMSGRLQPWLALASAVLIAGGLGWGLAFAPPDYQQGHSFRIIYVPVPAALLAQSIYIMLAAAGAASLVWKVKLADVALQHAAPVGAWMTLAALATGSRWGKPAWGAYWVWVARLTAMLVLRFLHLGIIAVGQSVHSRQSAGRACALLAVVGVVTLPFFMYSVAWWASVHELVTFVLAENPV